MLKIIKQDGNHRIVQFPNREGGFYYRSETVYGQMLLGTIYDTPEEALADFEHTIARHKQVVK